MCCIMTWRLEYLGNEMALLSANTIISHISGDSNARAVGGSICSVIIDDGEGEEEEYSTSSSVVT